MPLERGTSPSVVSENIRTEREHGKPEKQAIAIAENEKRASQDGYDANSYTTNGSTPIRNDEESDMPRGKDEEVKKEVEEVVEKRDAQEAANFEEVPAWAAGLMQTVKDAMRRLDDLEVKTKGGVPEVEDAQEGTERTAVAKDAARRDVEGYQEGGTFHPIRESSGYKRGLGGDPRRKPRRHDELEDGRRDAVGQPEASADNGPEAGRKFEAVEREQTRGESTYAGQGESPVTATEEEQLRLQRSREAGPERRELDPKLEDGVDRLNTSGQRRDLRGHDPEKREHHATDRMDAVIRRQDAQIRELTALVQRATRQPTIEDRNAIATARKRADGVYAALGRTTPEYMPGESPVAYRHRLADGLKDTSASLKKTVMDALPEDVFNIMEERIYSDALEASKMPGASAPMVLRPHTYQDTTGHTVTEYFGDPMAWMAPFMSAGARSKIHRPERRAQ